jgi:membrane associated rhomboid family serine protease
VTFGPGPWSPAVRAIILANIGVFLLTLAARDLVYGLFGLTPQLVLTEGRVWQLVTYLFVHDISGFSHLLFNMLYVWMFGTELERRWGTRAFTTYYFVTGVGAGVCVLFASLLPFPSAQFSYAVPTIGASGSVYGLLLAWAMTFPYRTILFIVFPMRAWVFAVIMGAIAFLSLAGVGGGGRVSHLAHVGGLVIGYLYLKGPTNMRRDLESRLIKWRMARLRRKFGVHQGGRPDWRDRIH